MSAQSTIRFADVRGWMFDAALPFWADRGFDSEAGVFRERLALDGSLAEAPFRRVRVLARQIYVYSHAHLMGWSGPAADRAERTFDYLVRHAWLGADRGWARRLAHDGSVEDATPDLYDVAFVMFALAWLIRAGLGGTRAPRLLGETLDFVQTHMRAEDGLGYREAGDSDSRVRLQNPHMHLTEAAVAAAAATGEDRYAALAGEIAALFRGRIFDRERGVLREVFGPGWTVLNTPAGRLTEPGHQMEWAWILTRLQEATGLDMAEEAHRLVETAEARGVDAATGLTYDGVDVDGAVINPAFRCWPQTEALKAQLATFERTGTANAPRIARIAGNLLDRYLEVTPRGSWADQLDPEGRPRNDWAPASTLYHVVLAFSELLRLEPGLRRAEAA